MFSGFRQFFEEMKPPSLSKMQQLDPNLVAQTAEPMENPQELMMATHKANRIATRTKKPITQVALAMNFKNRLKSDQS
jgi:hypothetical protein